MGPAAGGPEGPPREVAARGHKKRASPKTRPFCVGRRSDGTQLRGGQIVEIDHHARRKVDETGAPIGFHTIPKTYSGHPIQAEKDLGRAIGMGGCVRQSRVDAEWLYAWSRVGDTVVVLH